MTHLPIKMTLLRKERTVRCRLDDTISFQFKRLTSIETVQNEIAMSRLSDEKSSLRSMGSSDSLSFESKSTLSLSEDDSEASIEPLFDGSSTASNSLQSTYFPAVSSLDCDFFVNDIAAVEQTSQRSDETTFDEFVTHLLLLAQDAPHLSSAAFLEQVFTPQQPKRIIYETETITDVAASLDVDSILINSEHFPILKGPISFFPFINRRLNLSSDNKMTISLMIDDKSEEKPMVGIKHFCIAQSGPSSQFRTFLFFPELGFTAFKGCWHNFVEEKHLGLFYDELFYPYLVKVLSLSELSRLPSSYNLLKTSCRKSTGAYIFNYFLLSAE
jgi:hypothetical protein